MDEGLKMDDSDEKFCLNWNNFQSNFISQFEALKEDKDFVDVTLYCHGKCIKAHKVVLSACSSYLKNIFKEHPGEHPIIILDNLTFNNLESVIQFVYTGQTYVEVSDLPLFLKAAETLQIRGLFDPETTQTLIEESATQDSREKISGKRVANSDSEIKKISGKRKIERVTNSEQKENSEFQSNEKDCSFQNKSQAHNENLTPNQSNRIKDKSEYEEKTVEEDYTPDGKKAHWLDPRSCPLCNKIYSNLSNLRQHIKIMHNPNFVTCKLCYKTFKTDLYLRRHLVGFHAYHQNGSDPIFVDDHKSNHVQTYLKPDQIQTLNLNPIIKSENISFDEVFIADGIYQHQQ